MSTLSKRNKIVLLILILAIAVFFRFYKLAEIPPGLYPDVAMNGTNALDAIKTGDFKVFYPDNNGREGLFMNLIALSFLTFGASIWAIKIVSALFGIFTVLGTYLLAKQLFSYLNEQNHNTQNTNSKQSTNINIQNTNGFGFWNFCFGLSRGDIIALLSTFFIATSFWHVNFSRIGFRAIMVPFFLVWGLYFLFKAIRTYESHPNDPNKKFLISYFLFLISGIFFGLGFHTYIAFRIAPIIILPIFIIWLIKNWPRPKPAPWIIFIIFALLAAGPLLYYYAKNPADFMGRAGQVSVFASGNAAKALIQSTAKTLGQFVAIGDYNWRHNLSGSPQIFWPLIPFFIIGIIYSIRQILKRGAYRRDKLSLLATHWTLLVAWGAMLVPSITTAEGLPHALRSIGAIPPSYIFTGLGSYWLFTKIKYQISNIKNINQNFYPEQSRRTKIFNFTLPRLCRGFSIKSELFCVLIFAFCIALVYFSYRIYFIDWAKNPNVAGAFEQRFVDEASYLNSLRPDIKKYVIVNEDGTAVPYPGGIPMPSQTIMFLTRINQPETSVTYFKRDETSKLPDCLNCSIVILPMKYDQNLFNQLKQKYPGGKIEALGEFSVLKIGF